MLYQTKNPHGGDIYDGTVELDFSANTNPFGTPKGVLNAIKDSLSGLHRYPDPYCRKLIQAISQFEGVPESCILCGNGAAELIYSYCQAIVPQTAVEPAPTFSEYSLALERMGCHAECYVLHKENGFQLDKGFLAVLRERKPQAVFLCNPNNPTGQLTDPGLMREILNFTKENSIHMFVDECFLDLCQGGESLKQFLPDNPQLFLLKAFTKSYGMAGIRLGYCLCANPETLGKMASACQPWNVSTPAQAAGVAALKEDAFLARTNAMISMERIRMKKALENLGFWVSDSRTNYLLFQGTPGLDAALRRHKISIRSCANYIGLDESWYRAAVRLPEENDRLLRAIAQSLGKG